MYNKATAQRPTKGRRITTVSLASLLACVVSIGCRHDHLPSLSTGGHDYTQVNLVADTAGYNAVRIDTSLHNPWGISLGSTGIFWISVNHSGSTAIYDSLGNQKLADVDIPFNGIKNGSAPTGSVYNSTSGFLINGVKAKFIYASEDGLISGWVGGDTTTITAADRSASNTVYKGIAIANDGTGNFIYATDFHNGKVDVYDQQFNLVSNKPFSDPNIPTGFAPFNIRNIGGKLYVTYAKQLGPDNHDDQTGAGNGYVDIYNPDGSFVKRFATQGALNSPWGVIQAPAGFGQGTGAILVGNFGDGTINVFDSSGDYKGQLDNAGLPLYIDGLWDLAFSISNTSQLYFTAGPAAESHGLFGYIRLK